MDAIGEVLTANIKGFVAEAWREKHRYSSADSGLSSGSSLDSSSSSSSSGFRSGSGSGLASESAPESAPVPAPASGSRTRTNAKTGTGTGTGGTLSSTSGSPGPENEPSFGSFLKSRSEEARITVYGVVYDIITGPRDQHHKPVALQMTRSELRKEQPQIFSLLKTEWHVACIAYHDGKKIVPGLPPLPPEVHDFVFPLEREEVVQVTENLEFLRLVSGVPGGLHDELVAASIRSAAKARHEEYQYLVQAGQHLSKLFRDDYDRLGAVLRKIHPSTY